VCRPALLIADEPTTALDVTIQAQILKLGRDLQSELGMAVLLITHDLGVVANVADEVVVVYQGQLMESGSLRDVFERAGHPYVRALQAAIPHFDMKPGERLKPLREIKADAGALIRAASPRAPQAGADEPPILEVRGLTKSYTIRNSGLFGGQATGTVKAVDDISFFVRRGECLGLVGESGCGKTSLSKIIMRAMNPDSGQVLFNDRGTVRDLITLSERDLRALRPRMQFVFQDPYGSLNPRMTVYDILTEPLIINAIGTPATRRELVAELMNLVGLDARHLSRYPHSFSGGQRQRICIARALALRPDLLICDEPVSALDVSVQAQILNLLKDLQQQLGLTYLFVSHNLAVVDYMADRIAVMCAGRLVETAPRATLFGNPMHPYTQALLSAVPYPDPDRPLNFSALMEGKASVPSAWPEPFTTTVDRVPPWVDLGQEHFVRAFPEGLRIAA
jgi:peptide/nickel transport system ATP-binding protein